MDLGFGVCDVSLFFAGGLSSFLEWSERSGCRVFCLLVGDAEFEVFGYSF